MSGHLMYFLGEHGGSLLTIAVIFWLWCHIANTMVPKPDEDPRGVETGESQ